MYYIIYNGAWFSDMGFFSEKEAQEFCDYLIKTGHPDAHVVYINK